MELKVKRVKKGNAGFSVHLLKKGGGDFFATAMGKSLKMKRLPKGQTKALVSHNDGLVQIIEMPGDLSSSSLEALRNTGHSIFQFCEANQQNKVCIHNHTGEAFVSLNILEGLLLSSYQFNVHLSNPKSNQLKEVQLVNDPSKPAQTQELLHLVESVFWTRDLVNEPLSHLTATDLSKRLKSAGKEDGFRVEVFGKKKIESLKMGGILAVNRGSVDPPTFNILEWKPKKAKNKKPIILVGKGVVYDTGGLSLKPTAKSMDFMKSDMAGSAMMAGAMRAIAKNELPFHVIALIPASDNRPGGNAYAPGDIVTMFDGTTVEVLNTDAEGRMLLADALSYAKKFDPELVFDAATLTGAAVRSVGTYGSAIMGTADQSELDEFKKAGDETYERAIQFPIWNEYEKEMKSDIADLNNLGGPYAGQTTAGAFLKHFTDYPWIHVDIAGPSFLHGPST
ncbi:MAG: peptidase M17, partial [Bacteroidota bacterium]